MTTLFITEVFNEKQLEWKDEKVAETRAIIRLKEIIMNDNAVVAVGPWSCGKSTAIHYIALQLAKTMEYKIMPVNSPEQIISLFQPDSLQIFVIDDVLGVSTFDENKAQKWIDMSENIIRMLEKHEIKLLASCRSHIFKHRVVDTIDVLFKFSFDYSSINYSLTDIERQHIASFYLTDDEIKSLKASNVFSKFYYFPYLCRAYSKDTSSNVVDFFSNPIKVFNDHFSKLMSAIDRTTFAMLFLSVAFNNCIMERLFIEELKIKPILKTIFKNFNLNSNFSLEGVKKEIEKLRYTYLMNENNEYRLINNNMFDIFVQFCCEHQFDLTLKVAHVDVIRDRFILQRLLEEDQFTVVIIPPEKEDKYFERLKKDLKNGFVQNVFANQNLKDISFQSKFTKEILEDVVVSLPEKKVFSLLMSTIDRSLCDIVPRLLTNKIDLNQLYWDGETPLCKAAGKGYTEVVELLLKQNADPNFHACSNRRNHFYNKYPGIRINNDKYRCNYFKRYSPPPMCSYNIGKRTINFHKPLLHESEPLYIYPTVEISPLQIATSKGYTKIVKLLLTYNADPIHVNETEYIASPLYIASNHGYTKIVQLFLRNKYMLDVLNPNSKHKKYVSHLCFYDSLCIAVEKGHNEIVELMLNLYQHQIQIQLKEQHTESLYWNMIVIAVNNGHDEVLKLLLEKDYILDLSNEQDGLPLFKLICEGKIEFIKWLLVRKLDPNLCYHTQRNNESPLFRATSLGKIDIAKLLLENHCNPDICNSDNKSPMYIASWEGEIEMVKLLLEYKSDPNICDNLKESILHVAAYMGHTQIVKLLLENDCSINVCNKHNETPLFLASMEHKIEVVKLLLDHDCDVNICNDDDETPLSVASKKGHKEIVRLLLNHKSDPSVSNEDNESPFCVTSKKKKLSY